MMVEELGLSQADGAPWKDALVTFVAFLILGIFPSNNFCSNFFAFKSYHL
jgi:hypothetical protein